MDGKVHIDSHAAAIVKENGDWYLVDLAYEAPLNLSKNSEAIDRIMSGVFAMHLY